MLLNRYQADGVLNMAQQFWNWTLVSARVGVDIGITAFFTSFPVNIRVTRTGYPDENFQLVEDMRIAYLGVTS